MIDLSPMKGIHVDATARTARAQGGVIWRDFNRETQLHGLATTGGVVSTTGIAGLTLGGGIGWLMCKYGLALDNLLSIDMVMADGRVLRASEDENLDLFWAARGGGGNFGVATSFEYRLHAVGPTVTGGLLVYPFSTAKELLHLFREIASSLPDDVMMVAAFLKSPDGSGEKLAGIGVCHYGDSKDGETALRSIKTFGSPVMDTIGPTTYCQINTLMDAPYPRGALNYWKSHFLPELSDEALDTLIDCFDRSPSSMGQLGLEHFHGAAARAGIADTAFPLRLNGFNLFIISQWMDPAENERCIAWARETHAAMQPFAAPSRYVNYLPNDESGDAVAAAYGANYRRLRELKAKYDPENFFHINQNILPLPGTA